MNDCQKPRPRVGFILHGPLRNLSLRLFLCRKHVVFAFLYAGHTIVGPSAQYSSLSLVQTPFSLLRENLTLGYKSIDQRHLPVNAEHSDTIMTRPMGRFRYPLFAAPAAM